MAAGREWGSSPGPFFLAVLAAGIVVLASPGAGAPLDLLRSLWLTEERNPADLVHLGETIGPRTELRLHQHLLVRAADRESADWGYTAGQTFPVRNGNLWLAAARSGSEFRFRQGSDSLAIRSSRRERFQTGYSRPLTSSASVGAVIYWPLTAAWPREGAAGFRCYLRNRWRLDAVWQRLADSRQLSYENPSGQIALRILSYEETSAATVQGPVTEWLMLAAGGRWGASRPRRQADGYTLVTEGTTRSLQVRFEARLGHGMLAATDFRHRERSLRPGSTLDRVPFGRCRLELRDRHAFFNLERRQGGMSRLFWGAFAGSGNGHLRQGRLDNWPFVTSFAALVAGKDWSFWGDGEYEVLGTMVGLHYRSRRWLLSGSGYLVRLEGEYASTQRERTVFDLSSLFFPASHRTFGHPRADLADLGFGTAYRAGTWSIRYAFSQLVPLRLEPRTRSSKGQSTGGRQHEMTLVLGRGTVGQLW